MGTAKGARILGMLFIALSPLARVWAQQSDAAKIYSQSSKSVLLIFVKSADSKIVAQGTGFLVEGGKIITNKHVVRDGAALIDLGGVRIPATLESTDDLNDIAVLTVAAEISAEPLVLADRTPPPGSSVFAIGNPRGLEKSISTGVISGVRTVGKRELIQITTPISPGSSGGPVFDSSGKVIGVTVGSIEEGQNLNFAVPASVVVKLLRGQSLQSADFSTLVDVAQSLVEKRKTLQYSDEADSPFQKNQGEIRSAFSAAVERAGRDDLPDLLRISDQLSESYFYPGEQDIAVSAAERAIRLTPSSAGNLALAKALNLKAAFLSEPAYADQQKALLERAERAARQALSMTKQPSAEMYYWLGDTLEMRDSHQDADIALRRALELNRASPDAEQQARILRDLISAAEGLNRPPDIDKWFSSLSQTGQAGMWDWTQRAKRLDAAQRYVEAGESWQKSAEFNIVWTDWCEAAGSFELASGREDSTLYTARQCIALGAGKAKSEGRLSDAHRAIASVLSDRGVYEEALSHAKEATALNPENASAYDQQAVALLGLYRNQEAINAAKQAIRLSDGKYGIMHFHLGSAYFETENWQFARQSFEKAAELMPTSDASAYNVALCFQHLSLYLDSARWYEEVLRRNPNRTDKQQILNLISTLRR
jgi:tetratricopeptide (TPR) repeat protein